MRTLAGIVVYKPDVKRLTENIDAVQGQVDQVVLYVNGRESLATIASIFVDHVDLVTIVSEENQGIAVGLAEIMTYAQRESFDWVLTVDQDSVCRPGLVNEYLKWVDLPDSGMLTCNIEDRNFVQPSGFSGGQVYRKVEKCITAGAFTSVRAYSKTPGYDRRMFIDGVDWDICYALRRAGFSIYKVNYDGLLHEVGHGKNVSLLGKKYVAYGESALRNYYGARNDIYLARKYPEILSMPKTLLRELRAELIVLFFEGEKGAKLRSRWHGVREGFRMETEGMCDNRRASSDCRELG